MPSRCIMVLSVPRAGSSCVAGILHKLGVDMGAGYFQPDDWANPKGYFEDLRWRHATQRITGRGYSLRAAQIESIGGQQKKLYRQLARQCSKARLWGMKDPWLCFVGQFVWPILRQQGIDVRIVSIHRDKAASIASVQKHLDRSYHGKGDAKRIIDTWHDAYLATNCAFHNGRTFGIPYEMLIEHPKAMVEQLADFAFEDIGRPRADLVKIARWVSADLNHHKGVTT